jgi:uncharacterized secreted protein with C-terminal beta-propeller domain
MKYKIIYGDDTKLAESEALTKGYRNDVSVIIDNKKYNLYITDLTRLNQDFETEVKQCGYYYSEPNTIIVREVTKNEITKTVEELFIGGYFNTLGAI